jgi:Protein of unknown function (DUF3761)
MSHAGSSNQSSIDQKYSVIDDSPVRQYGAVSMGGRPLAVSAAVAACAAFGAAPAGAACGVAGSEACRGEAAQPVASLRAVVTAHHGSSYKHPGYSSLELISTPEAAYMTAGEPATRTHLRWLTDEEESNVVRVPWECKRPHETFRYALTARGEVGATVSATAVFRAQLSARWCAAAKAKEEAAARQRREAEARAAEKRAAERRAAEQRRAREREEALQTQEREMTSTCTNGTYVNSSGNTVCKPEESSTGPPPGATAECEDGTFSFSEHRSGTCSDHGGVKRWL